MGSVQDVLSRAVAGERISTQDALYLIENADLLELGITADFICRQRHPQEYRTYVVDRNINYTNVCTSGCKFCAFYRSIDSPDAYLLSDAEIFSKVSEAVDLGATQILMQGGLHPELDITYFEQLIYKLKERFNVHMHFFSPPEIVHISKISNLPVKDVLIRLKDAGLDSIPGGGAEILTDTSRSALSPGKCTTDEWLGVMETTHSLGLPTTATMMFGHIEKLSDRIEHLARIRGLQDKTGGFTAFIPWTFQSKNTEIGGEPVGAHDYLRTLAVSRLFLDNFDNIQASWVTQGPKIGQIALHFGANDLGSTMIEENVVAAAGVTFRMKENEIKEAIRDAGFTPRRRDTYYRLLE